MARKSNGGIPTKSDFFVCAQAPKTMLRFANKVNRLILLFIHSSSAFSDASSSIVTGYHIRPNTFLLDRIATTLTVAFSGR